MTELNLTEKQLTIAELLLLGLSNKEMALKLKVQPTTVKWHLRIIFKKANVKSRYQFVVKYFKEENHDRPIT